MVSNTKSKQLYGTARCVCTQQIPLVVESIWLHSSPNFSFCFSIIHRFLSPTGEEWKETVSYSKAGYENSKAQIFSLEQNERMWVLQIDLYFFWTRMSVCYELRAYFHASTHISSNTCSKLIVCCISFFILFSEK